MTHRLHIEGNLGLPFLRGLGFRLTARLEQSAEVSEPIEASQRALRALRSEVMAELAMAWRSPGCRQHWRATLERAPKA